MIIMVDRSGTIDALKDLLLSVSASSNVRGLLVLSCDSNGFKPELVDQVLKDMKLPLFGGIFPGIIYGKETLNIGTIVAGLPSRPNIQIITGLSDIDITYDDLISGKIPDTGSTRTMFVLVDGFSSRIAALIESIFNVFGLEFNYIGGGAGSLTMRQKPCLFTNQGLIMDSAVLAMLNLKSGVGVSHGWTAISGPYIVTESDGNVIRSLDWKPAFQVYKSIIENRTGRTITNATFFNIAKSYPFGISKIGTERIIRDPIIMRDDGSIVCVGEVPEQSLVDIMTSDATFLVKAAQRALHLGLDSYKGNPAEKTVLLMDCISRMLCLENDFIKELNAVAVQDTPMIGALTIGEIANSGKDYLEFYNKTAVVGVLEG